MRHTSTHHRNRGIASFVRVVRAIAEASLVALAAGFAILLIGLPIALSVRGVHASLSWLARFAADIGTGAEALVSVASIVGGILVTTAFARVLVGFFRWRRALRGEARSGTAATQPVPAGELRPSAG